MTEVRELPRMDRVEEEASLWIARLNAENVSVQDCARFEAWLRAHPLHARVYENLRQTWNRFTAAGPWVRAVSIGQSLNEAAQMRAPRRRGLIAAAAAAVVLAVLGLVQWLEPMRERLFQTAIGEHAAISLPDGSTLELNSGSRARVAYSEQARVIQLEQGEAFFKVAADRARPFWVAAGGSWVRALGTAFNVDLRPSGVRITVSEGRVKVSPADRLSARVPTNTVLARSSTSVLSAGQQLDLEDGFAAIRTLPPVEVDRSVAWRGGSVNFERHPLSEVVEELRPYTTLHLFVEDEALRALWVGGTFETNPQGVEDFITMLHSGLGLHVRREADKVYIERARTNKQAPGTRGF